MESRINVGYSEWVAKLESEGFTEKHIKILRTDPQKVMLLTRAERQRLLAKLKEIFGEEEKEKAPAPKLPKVQPQQAPEGGAALFQSLLTECMMDALHENNKELIDTIENRVVVRITKELNFLFKEREAMEEDRYRRLDQAIREKQKKKLPNW